jgi:hypothetical protein
LAGLIESAEHSTVLTLWAEPDVLLDRARNRAFSTIKLVFFPWRHNLLVHNLRPDWQRYQAYRHPASTQTLYTQWFEFCQRYPTPPHWVLNTTKADITAAVPLSQISSLGIPFSPLAV